MCGGVRGRRRFGDLCDALEVYLHITRALYSMAMIPINPKPVSGNRRRFYISLAAKATHFDPLSLLISFSQPAFFLKAVGHFFIPLINGL